MFQKLYFKCNKLLKFYSLEHFFFLLHLQWSRASQQGGNMCNIHLWWKEKWPLSNCPTEMKIYWEESNKGNVICTKNWAIIGGNTLKIIRWCYCICQKSSAKQFHRRAMWLKVVKSASGNFLFPLPLSINGPRHLHFKTSSLQNSENKLLSFKHPLLWYFVMVARSDMHPHAP